MSRIDKYNPHGGNFRAPLAADYDGVTAGMTLGLLKPVSLDANGRVVLGVAAQSGFVGVICLTEKKYAGDIVDVMHDGEVVEFTLSNGAAAAAGTAYVTAAEPGGYAAGAPGAGGIAPFKIGHTVEADRLIVHCGTHQDS